MSGKEPELASGNKKWAELIACANGMDLDLVSPFAFDNVDTKKNGICNFSANAVIA